MFVDAALISIEVTSIWTDLASMFDLASLLYIWRRFWSLLHKRQWTGVDMCWFVAFADLTLTEWHRIWLISIDFAWFGIEFARSGVDVGNDRVALCRWGWFWVIFGSHWDHFRQDYCKELWSTHFPPIRPRPGVPPSVRSLRSTSVTKFPHAGRIKIRRLVGTWKRGWVFSIS